MGGLSTTFYEMPYGEVSRLICKVAQDHCETYCDNPIAQATLVAQGPKTRGSRMFQSVYINQGPTPLGVINSTSDDLVNPKPFQ